MYYLKGRRHQAHFATDMYCPHLLASHLLTGQACTHLHRDVHPKVMFANKTQYILLFVTEIQSSIGLLKSFIVGKYPYQHSKTITNYILGENLDIVILATKYKIN